MKKLYFLKIALVLVNGAVAQWVPVDIDTTIDLHRVFFPDENTGFAIGNSLMHGIILKTTDGGTSWTTDDWGSSFSFYSVNFTDLSTGYLSDVNTITDVSTVYKTNNGGMTLDSLFYLNDTHLMSIFFIDANTGFFAGRTNLNTPPATGIIRKTSDGGITWTDHYVSKSQYCIHFPDENTGYSAGFKSICKTTDYGQTWIEELLTENVFLYSIFFTDVNAGFAVGETFSGQGVIYRTTDGGINWMNQSYDVFLTSVYFTDSNTGYIVGDSGTILKTTDGGTTWANQASGTSKLLSSVFFPGEYTGYIVGHNGILLKTTNGGVTNLDKNFGVTENIKIIPNPSINKITISSVALTGITQLSIFNVSGEKVMERQLTNNETQIDISALPRGVYFVRVQDEEMIDVTKLIKQ